MNNRNVFFLFGSFDNCVMKRKCDKHSKIPTSDQTLMNISETIMQMGPRQVHVYILLHETHIMCSVIIEFHGLIRQMLSIQS